MPRFICYVFFCATYFSVAQEKYKVRTIAFYNVENLFDIKNDSLIFDDDRTPEGKYSWNQQRFETKIENIAKVISEIGKEITHTAPDIMGLCEIENKNVLTELAKHKYLANKNYKIVHYDSPDNRGIDVGLLYKDDAFLLLNSRSHRLLLFDEDGKRDYTRDQLVVSGYLDNELVHIIVNHWPSRRGGATKSSPLRYKAAQLTKRIIDSIEKEHYKAKIITMGDFNDDPIDKSIKKVLKSKGKKKKLDSLSLFNPMEKLFRKGHGTLAYRDKWNLFDQLLLTNSLISENRSSWSFWKAGIYNPTYLSNITGKYKGYPFRTYVGTTYQGGYSDHFPVFVYLIKSVPEKVLEQ